MTPPLDGRGEGQTNLERVEIRDNTAHTQRERERTGWSGTDLTHHQAARAGIRNTQRHACSRERAHQ